ncbi:unnamed protein product [Closterium sp. Naga37s-1]|nr:unnamed protein product [Closterium sp. Naga37s-1]
MEGEMPPTATHVHNATEGSNGPKVLDLPCAYQFDESLAAWSCKGVLGKNLAERTATLVSTLDAIRKNPSGFYGNIHTVKYPDGAVHGGKDETWPLFLSYPIHVHLPLPFPTCPFQPLPAPSSPPTLHLPLPRLTCPSLWSRESPNTDTHRCMSDLGPPSQPPNPSLPSHLPYALPAPPHAPPPPCPTCPSHASPVPPCGRGSGAGRLTNEGGEEDEEKKAGFSEQDQENLYNLVHDHATSGKQGLGIGDLPRKVAGARWKGTKQTFEDLEEVSEGEENEEDGNESEEEVVEEGRGEEENRDGAAAGAEGAVLTTGAETAAAAVDAGWGDGAGSAEQEGGEKEGRSKKRKREDRWQHNEKVVKEEVKEEGIRAEDKGKEGEAGGSRKKLKKGSSAGMEVSGSEPADGSKGGVALKTRVKRAVKQALQKEGEAGVALASLRDTVGQQLELSKAERKQLAKIMDTKWEISHCTYAHALLHPHRPCLISVASRPSPLSTSAGDCPVLGKGFFFGLATAPAHVEDQLDDAWLKFARRGSNEKPDRGPVRAWHNVPKAEQRLRFWTEPEVEVDLAARAGVEAFRMGVDWGRIVLREPQGGKMEIDHGAVARYKEIMALVRARGMRVMLTLFHHSLPSWAEPIGGWTNASLVDHFDSWTQ